MSETSTYRAVLLGPGVLGNAEERELDFVDGTHQESIVTEDVVDGAAIIRTWRLGRETAEPVPYYFVEEDDEGGTPSVPN